MAASSLHIRHVKKNYGDQAVLKDIDLQLEPGGFLVLLGPSGCGKSTLLNMIAGLEPISEGEIRMDERVINHVHPKDRDIAMVFQSYALYPNLTVRRNMAFPLKMRGLTQVEQDQAVARVSKFLQLDALLERKPGQLSGGQRQRVAMGRALVRDPRIFLFDEPLSNLDAKLRVDMRTEIKKLHDRLGTTIVYVTHDQIEAMTLATHVAVMKDGVLQQFADPDTVYRKPANLFVAGFVGSPAMNFIPGRVVQGEHGVVLQVGAASAREGLALQGSAQATAPISLHAVDAKLSVGQDVVLGLRPESITLVDTQSALPASAYILEAEVEVIEPTGADKLVVLNLGGHEVMARLRANDPVHKNQRGRFAVDMAVASLFDAGSGQRL